MNSNRQHQETLEQSTKKTKKKQGTSYIYGLIIGLVSFLLVTLSLFHVFLSAYSPEYLAHKKTYKTIIKKRDNGTIHIIEDYVEYVNKNFKDKPEVVGKANELILNYKNHYKKANSEVKNYNKVKKKLAYAHSFRGRNSVRFWLAYIGIAIGMLFFSAKSLYNDLQKGSSFRFHFISISGIIISSFWIIHFVFLTQKDFDSNKYFIILIICGFCSSFFTYFMIKNYSYKDDMILNQLSLIERIKTVHYPLVAAKAKYAEKYTENYYGLTSTEEEVNNFQSDVKKSLNL